MQIEQKVWKRCRNSADIVIAHPNGWGLPEQATLRRAAIAANVVHSEQDSREKVRFVTEAEASVHFVIQNAELKDRLEVRLLKIIFEYNKNAGRISLKARYRAHCVRCGGIDR